MNEVVANGAMVATVTASLWLVGCAEAPQTVVETQSPGGRYSVRLFGQPGDSPMFGQNRVYVDARHGNAPLVQAEEVHSAGFLDSGFHNSFDAAAWTAGNVLWFPTNRGSRTQTRDELWIENQVDVSIEFLRVNTRDLFLIFDLSPGVRLRLDATAFRATGDVSWLVLKGRAGAKTLAHAAHFELTGPRSTRDAYDVRISQSGIDVIHRTMN